MKQQQKQVNLITSQSVDARARVCVSVCLRVYDIRGGICKLTFPTNGDDVRRALLGYAVPTKLHKSNITQIRLTSHSLYGILRIEKKKKHYDTFENLPRQPGDETISRRTSPTRTTSRSTDQSLRVQRDSSGGFKEGGGGSHPYIGPRLDFFA